MIKATVLYPSGEGKKFDLDYYLGKHIPFVQELLGKLCQRVTVDVGLAGGTPGSPAPFVVITHLYFATMNDLQTALTTHMGPMMADVPNFTDIVPTAQISDEKL